MSEIKKNDLISLGCYEKEGKKIPAWLNLISGRIEVQEDLGPRKIISERPLCKQGAASILEKRYGSKIK